MSNQISLPQQDDFNVERTLYINYTQHKPQYSMEATAHNRISVGWCKQLRFKVY